MPPFGVFHSDFFRHNATFLKNFEFHQMVSPSFVSMFCNTMDLKKNPKGSPFTFLGTVTLFKNLINPNEPSDALKQPTFFFQILIPFASSPFSLAQFLSTSNWYLD